MEVYRDLKQQYKLWKLQQLTAESTKTQANNNQINR